MDGSQRLDMENRQLRMQLSAAQDQARKYRELNVNGSDAYNNLVSKIRKFCGQITSDEDVRGRLLQPGGAKMSPEELMDNAVLSYQRQKTEFMELVGKLSAKSDSDARIIADLKSQISVYEIERSQPNHISDIPLYQDTVPQKLNDAQTPGVPDGIMPPVPGVSDGVPEGITAPPAPDVPDGIMPPVPGETPAGVFSVGKKKTVYAASEEDDFVPISEVIPRAAAEITSPGAAPGTVPAHSTGTPVPLPEKTENPDGGQYVPPSYAPMTAEAPKDSAREAVIERLKQKEAAEKQAKMQKLMLTDISKLIGETAENPVWKGVFSAIGEKGMSQKPKIEDWMTADGGGAKAGKTTVSTSVTEMQKAGLIDRVNINTGYRHFIALSFTPAGRRVFEEVFGKSPVLTELEILTKENASAEHGYLINDSKEILLKELGYKYVSIDRAKNTIQLNDGRKYIPDIVASMDGKTWDYMEVERGTHTQKDFSEKLDKMFMVTRVFCFIAPKAETLDIIREKTDAWLTERQNSGSSSAGLTVKYTTASALAKKQWLSIKKY